MPARPQPRRRCRRRGTGRRRCRRRAGSGAFRRRACSRSCASRCRPTTVRARTRGNGRRRSATRARRYRRVRARTRRARRPRPCRRPRGRARAAAEPSTRRRCSGDRSGRRRSRRSARGPRRGPARPARASRARAECAARSARRRERRSSCARSSHAPELHAVSGYWRLRSRRRHDQGPERAAQHRLRAGRSESCLRASTLDAEALAGPVQDRTSSVLRWAAAAHHRQRSVPPRSGGRTRRADLEARMGVEQAWNGGRAGEGRSAHRGSRSRRCRRRTRGRADHDWGITEEGRKRGGGRRAASLASTIPSYTTCQGIPGELHERVAIA